ncbi:MAG: NADH-quinone oxidoreductase subunit A [Myxococcota bacterium]
MSEYAGLALFMALGTGFVGLMLILTTVLGPKLHFGEKQEPFECGERQLVSPYRRFHVKFYMVAVSFIIFDVEVVFLYPWAVVYRDLIAQGLGWLSFGAMMTFLFALAAALAYEWMKGGLDWN